MTRPLGTALIGCAHDLPSERLTLGEANRLEAGEKVRKRLWWLRLFGGMGEDERQALVAEAPAGFFKQSEKEQHEGRVSP